MDALELLRQIASIRRYNSSSNYPRRVIRRYTLNVPIELLEQIDAFIAEVDRDRLDSSELASVL